jgi:hypothetical protein
VNSIQTLDFLTPVCNVRQEVRARYDALTLEVSYDQLYAHVASKYSCHEMALAKHFLLPPSFFDAHVRPGVLSNTKNGKALAKRLLTLVDTLEQATALCFLAMLPYPKPLNNFLEEAAFYYRRFDMLKCKHAQMDDKMKSDRKRGVTTVIKAIAPSSGSQFSSCDPWLRRACGKARPMPRGRSRHIFANSRKSIAFRFPSRRRLGETIF